MEGSEIWISFRRIWIPIPLDFDFVPTGFDFLPTDFEFLPRVLERRASFDALWRLAMIATVRLYRVML
jgi:hypothetical protein